MADGFTLGKNFCQGLGTQHIAEGGGYQQVGRVGVVADVADGGQRVGDLVKADGVDADSHRIA